eukprot:COSAG05_NODE_8129_length_734_cov_0.737008_1_plen_140_part_00
MHSAESGSYQCQVPLLQPLSCCTHVIRLSALVHFERDNVVGLAGKGWTHLPADDGIDDQVDHIYLRRHGGQTTHVVSPPDAHKKSVPWPRPKELPPAHQQEHENAQKRDENSHLRFSCSVSTVFCDGFTQKTVFPRDSK